MINVLFVLPSLGRGGAEMHTVRLANELDRTKFSVTIACMRGGGDYEAALDEDIRLVALSPGFIRSAALGCLASLPRLRSLLRRGRFNVICAVLPQSLVAVGRVMATGAPRVPVVACIQNNLSADFQHADSASRLTWNTPEFPRLINNASAVVALSEGVKVDVVSRFPRTADTICAIPNIGCTQELLEIGKMGRQSVLDNRTFSVIACGRLEEQKDYPTLLQAVAIARQDRDIRLRILGRGRLESSLRTLALSLGISDAVDFLGFQTDPHDFIRNADLFVLASRWEGFGNVLVEAMACGVPVTSTDCPFGPAEILADGEFGDLVPVGDSPALARSILALAGNPARRADLSRRGLARATEFSAGPIASRYESVIQSVAC